MILMSTNLSIWVRCLTHMSQPVSKFPLIDGASFYYCIIPSAYVGSGLRYLGFLKNLPNYVWKKQSLAKIYESRKKTRGNIHFQR